MNCHVMHQELQRRIMVVDDNADLGEFLESVLIAEGWNTIWVSSGMECLGKVTQGFHGLILLDVKMEQMDGWDTLCELVNRGMLPGNLVCMVTGDFDPGAKSENLQKYVFDYIPKPFKLTDFLRVVRQAMEVIHNQTL